MRHIFKYYDHTDGRDCIYCKLNEYYYIHEIANIIDKSEAKISTDDLNKIIEERFPCLTDEEWEVKQIII